jgi:hypothetical protein
LAERSENSDEDSENSDLSGDGEKPIGNEEINVANEKLKKKLPSQLRQQKKNLKGSKMSKKNFGIHKNKNLVGNIDKDKERRDSVIPDRVYIANTAKLSKKDSEKIAQKALFQQSPFGKLVEIDEILLEGKNRLLPRNQAVYDKKCTGLTVDKNLLVDVDHFYSYETKNKYFFSHDISELQGLIKQILGQLEGLTQ